MTVLEAQPVAQTADPGGSVIGLPIVERVPTEEPSCGACPLREGEARCPCRAQRICLASVGVISVGLGALGVVVPGLPTTVFLIVAAWCFARSSPALERKLLHNRLFRPYMRYLDGSTPMPMRARIVTIAIIWTASLISASMFAARGGAGLIAAAAVVTAAGVGSWCVLRWRRVAAAR